MGKEVFGVRNLSSDLGRKRNSVGRWSLALGVLVPAVVLLANVPPRAEKTQTFQTSLSPRITLSNLSGEVIVRGWDKTQVHAVYSTASPLVSVEAEPVPSKGPAEKIYFETQIQDPTLSAEAGSVNYTLDVPLGASLEIRNRQGVVRIQKLAGDAWVESVGGDIVAEDVGGHLAVRSVGGNIEVIRPAGRVEASSITGNLHFISPTTAKLRGNTTSGKIVYEGDFAPGGDYVLSEYSGQMEIICPASASFELNAKSVHGKVITDPELSLIPKPHAYAPAGASSFSGMRNNGAATVELTSFSGNIHIRHGSPKNQ